MLMPWRKSEFAATVPVPLLEEVELGLAAELDDADVQCTAEAEAWLEILVAAAAVVRALVVFSGTSVLAVVAVPKYTVLLMCFVEVTTSTEV